MLTYRNLAQSAYDALRYQVLLNVEETGDPKEATYLDSKGIPTIGIGFNLRSGNVLNAVLKKFGFNINSAKGSPEYQYIDQIKSILNSGYASAADLNTALNAVMNTHYNDANILAANRTRSSFQFLNDGEIRGVFDGLIGGYEGKVDAWLSGIPITAQERVALVSLAWNNAGKLLGNGLKTALQSGNRAEAWYEIRYGSNGDKLGGIAKRRYYESELFGLYNDQDSISTAEKDQEAKGIYKMYGAHRAAIEKYEAAYGHMIAQANTAYVLSGTHTVGTLAETLKPAYDYLIGEYATKAGIDATAINIRDIFVGNDSSVLGANIGGGDFLSGSGNSELMLGEGGRDTLTGNDGNDILYGGTGDDTLNGGVGDDNYVYIVGDGKDVIIDSDGQGKIIIAGNASAMQGSSRQAFQLNLRDTWFSDDGQFQYRLVNGNLKDGGTLEITGAGVGTAGQITVKHFKNGQLGITLNNRSELTWLKTGGANPFTTADAAVIPLTSTLNELGGNGLKIALNRAAQAGDKIIVQLQGGDPALFALVDGANTTSFAGGPVLLELIEGQTEVTLALLNTGDVDSNQTLTLRATLQQANPESGTQSVTADMSIDFTAIDEAAQALPTGRDIVGDLAPIDFDAGPAVVYHYDDLGNVITDPAQAVVRADTLYDSTGNDHIQPGAGDDKVLATRGGDDRINGDAGRDDLYGGEGNDLVEGGADGDLLTGGAGDDRLYAETQQEVLDALQAGRTALGKAEWGEFLSGNDGRDRLVGGDKKDVLAGGDGNDTLIAGAGDDYIAGDNDDIPMSRDWNVQLNIRTESDNSKTYNYTLNGAYVGRQNTQGDDVIYAGAGDDAISADAGDDMVYGEDGNDHAWGWAGNDTLLGGAGDDMLSGDNGKAFLPTSLHGGDFLDGGEGNDELSGGGKADTLFGGAGDDVLTGDDDEENAGNDYLDGEDGNDKLYGAAGADTLFGGAGKDALYGDSKDTSGQYQGNDYLDGEAGDDLLNGAGGADALFGGEGNDQLFGDASDVAAEFHGADYLDGEEGDDLLNGGGGADELFGGAGADELYGDASSATQGNDYLDGGDGNDTLIGGGGADDLHGGTGDDVLDGDGAGIEETLSGDDYLEGNEGNDQLVGSGGSDILDGGAGDDSLTGDSADTGSQYQGEDYLNGGDGNDALVGGGKADTLFGGNGSDRLDGDGLGVAGDAQGNDYLDGGDGDDILIGSGGADTLIGAGGNDALYGDVEEIAPAFHGDDTLDGGEGNDILVGAFGNDTLLGGLGNDQLYGDTGEAGGQYHGDDILNGGDGDDSLAGNGGNDMLYGGASSDQLYGDDGNDTLMGGEGDDLLLAGSGSDVLEGGDGSDVYVYNLGDGVDVIRDNGANTLRFGYGIGNSSLSLALGSLQIKVGNNGDVLHLENFNPDDALAGAGITRFEFSDGTVLSYGELVALGFDLNGTGGDDVIYGTNVTDRINGYAGNDTLIGKAGNDVLDGGTGSDVMQGDAGDDQYLVDDAADRVVESADAGFDTVNSTVSYSLAQNVDNLELQGTDSLDGTGNELGNTLRGNNAANRLMGQAGSDTIDGKDGNDVLDGGEGNDSLRGGFGDDTYIVDQSDDSIIEERDVIDHTPVTDAQGNTRYGVIKRSGGVDTVISSASYTLWDHVENLTLTGKNSSDGFGNVLSNRIEGNEANNILRAYRLNGRIENLAETVYFNFNPIDGIDERLLDRTQLAIYRGDVSPDIPSDIEFRPEQGDRLIGNGGDDKLYGDLDNDTLVGGDGNDLLYGFGGQDTMIGGAGDDTYIVDKGYYFHMPLPRPGKDSVGMIYRDDSDDTLIEAADAGIDTVKANVDYALAENFENLVLLNDTSEFDQDAGVYGLGIWGRYRHASAGIGNNVNNRIVANDYGNTLEGRGGDDTLMGGMGSDRLDGGSGADTMVGGSGWDTYVVDAAGDQVMEVLVYGGVDTVESGIDYRLGGNLENLVLTGVEDLEGIGNELNNIVRGNVANNALSGLDGDDSIDGGAGDDVMMGGMGNDIYYVDSISDITLEDANSGGDVVHSQVTHTLASNVESLYLTGLREINGTGNDLDNLITGNRAVNVLAGLEGNDRIDGQYGNDTMLGGAGNDSYVVDSTQDLIIENAAEGIDGVESSATYTLSENVENLYLRGDFFQSRHVSSLDGTGNELGNAITGNDGANLLQGLGGEDVINGRAGNDTILGGDGNDALQGGSDAVYREFCGFGGGGFGRQMVSIAILARPAGGYREILADNADTLRGGSGNDSIDGGSGNDFLYGDDGDDVMYGGDDGLSVSSGCVNPWLVRAAPNDMKSVPAGEWVFLGNDDHLEGGLGNDRLDGGSGDDYLAGGEGSDYLFGGADGRLNVSNNDYLDGGKGLDTMAGGTGDDIYVVDGVCREAVHEEMEDDQYRLINPFQKISDKECRVSDIAEHAPAIHADDGSDDLSYGDDDLSKGIYIEGLLQGDQSDGDCESDIFGAMQKIACRVDTVIENRDEGIDTVHSSVNYTLTANVENLVLTGKQALWGAGNELNNQLTGNAARNYLAGGAGNDLLDGGAGADWLLGGQGDDTYVVDNAWDHIYETWNEGVDAVQSSVSYRLGDNIEALTLIGSAAINGWGNRLDNKLVGNEADNRLDGGRGADTLAGGNGNDVYIIDDKNDVVLESAASGTDWVYASLESYALGAEIENLSLTNRRGATGQGNALDNVIVGAGGDDTLLGAQGNDILDGGRGADSLVGGLGDDVYVVDNRRDTITEADGEGMDTVRSLVDYVLGDHVENLTLLGGDDIDATGNAFSNVLTGNAGDNRIDGDAGADTLLGGDGDDLLGGAFGSADYASEGNRYVGGRGNDFLRGTEQGDHYQFDLGDGEDRIQDRGNSQSADVLQLGAGIAKEQLWFHSEGRDLVISILGTADSITVRNWYRGSDYHLEQIRTSNGDLLLDSQVENLRSAMAAFSPYAGSAVNLGTGISPQLEPVLAANWQHVA